MSTTANFDSNEETQYRAFANSTCSCKSKRGSQYSNPRKYVNDFIDETAGNASSDLNLSMETNAPTSNKYLTDYDLTSDSSINKLSSVSEINLSLENNAPSSRKYLSDFSSPLKKSSVQQISFGEKNDIKPNYKLEDSRHLSKKYDVPTFSIAGSDETKRFTSSKMRDSISTVEDVAMDDFVNTYDWKKNSHSSSMVTRPSNYSSESKGNIETFISPNKGWNRVFEKYSPSTEILHSPIKPTEGNVKPDDTNSQIQLAQLWIVSMSEQFYYDNSITLIHKYHDVPVDLNHALIINSRFMNTDKIMNTLVDVVVLGSGTFGNVYRVRKKDTEEYIAVKYLKKVPSSKFYQHVKIMMEYFRERNSLIKARNSPFVVQFISSLNFPGISGLFLFFEWCLCDLRRYIKLVSSKEKFKILTKGLWEGLKGGIRDLLEKTYSTFSDDLFTVTLVYIFEIFCGIDFLAKCNIVHQDLKPENFMIATNFHLKIADFGLAYNTRFITSQSQIHLVGAQDLNRLESLNYKAVWGGTSTYEDMELCYRAVLKEELSLTEEIINHTDNIQVPLSTSKKDANPDFMSDLWSCGIIATELIFGGAHIFRPGYIPEAIRSEMLVTPDFRHSVLALTYIKENYVRYIEKGFVNYGGPEYEDLMKFLASIFKPRQERAAGFVKEKEIYRYKTKINLKYIDINKVEEISVFANMGLTSNNVFIHIIPKGLNELLSKPLIPTYDTLGDLLTSIPTHDQQEFVNLKPGIHLSYF